MLLKIYHSLPVQLLLLNLKRNRLILLLWVVLFTIITGKFARTYGIPYLFLDPEYLNDVNFWSLFILGYAFGIFSMSYHITIYILESYRFQFLMIRENSFSRFCLNNSSFPFLFILIYIYNFIHFQLVQGGQQLSDIMIEVGGFLLGFHITLLLTLVYFGITGSKIFKAFTQSLNDTLKTKKMNRVVVIQKIKMVKKRL